VSLTGELTDPFVQAPYHTQSLNRYSYVWNNPLTLIDPSGFQAGLPVLPTFVPRTTASPSPSPGCATNAYFCGDPCLFGSSGWCEGLDSNDQLWLQETLANQTPRDSGGGGGGGNAPVPQFAQASSSIFRDNFAGRVLKATVYNADFMLGWAASPVVDGETRGFFTGYVPTDSQLEEAKMSFVTLGLSRYAAGLRDTMRAARGAPLAGSIRNVNPLGSTTNCVNCVVATHAMLSGRAASALASGPVPISALETAFGSTFARVGGQSAIEAQLLRAGHGAQGVVYGSRGAGQVGHVFNAVNQNGVVRFLDGQTGGAASFAGYQDFFFMMIP
jgi:papain fold toxin 1 (glutamine deamidase) of polymorphic toxin system